MNFFFLALNLCFIGVLVFLRIEILRPDSESDAWGGAILVMFNYMVCLIVLFQFLFEIVMILAVKNFRKSFTYLNLVITSLILSWIAVVYFHLF